MTRHAIFIGMLSVLLAGCDRCNHCGEDRRGLHTIVFVARFPANDPALAVRVRKALAHDCIGEFWPPGREDDVWIYADDHEEAACVRRALASQSLVLCHSNELG